MKHLCVVPFINLASRTNGEVRYCCFAPGNRNKKPTGESYNWGDDPIEEIWNSEHSKNFRMRMIKGEKVEECENCWKQESAGKVSKRKIENKYYLEENLPVIKYAEKNNGKTNQLPIYLDLRPGNLCNLKCRSCNSDFSSKLALEVDTKWDKSLPFYSENKLNELDKLYLANWYKTETFWSNLKKMLPGLVHVYISGGEPTIIPKIRDFLKLCVSSGHAKHIKLRFNTNLMTFDQVFFDFLPEFRSVSLVPSIDAFGDRLAYIRHPLRWTTFEKNFIKCLQLPGKITISVNCVTSLLNVLYFDELYLKIQELGDNFGKEIEVATDILHTPPHLSPDILFPELKSIVRKRNEKLFKKMRSTEIVELKSVLNLMDEEPENVAELRKKFVLFTKQLDGIRKENFKKVFPELRAMLG